MFDQFDYQKFSEALDSIEELQAIVQKLEERIKILESPKPNPVEPSA